MAMAQTAFGTRQALNRSRTAAASRIQRAEMPLFQAFLRPFSADEITNTARVTKMNMTLAGDGHSNIFMRNSLANPIYGTKTYFYENGIRYHYGYDIVLANMPYSRKVWFII